MKLYYKTGTCALAVHMALIWSKIPYELEAVDLTDPEFRKLNPLGAVPAMMDDDGPVMTQVHALISYIAMKAPDAEIAGKISIDARQAFDQWMSFLSSDLHAAFVPVFAPGRFTKRTDEDHLAMVSSAADDRLKALFAVLDAHLNTREYVVGKRRTGADALAYVLTRWMAFTGLDLNEYPDLKRHFDRFHNDPATMQARLEEGMTD